MKQSPKCPKCNKQLKPAYKDQSNLPIQYRTIGEMFSHWEHDGECITTEIPKDTKAGHIADAIQEMFDNLHMDNVLDSDDIQSARLLLIAKDYLTEDIIKIYKPITH